MAKKLDKPGVIEPILSLVIALIVIYLAYLGWLHWKGKHIAFQVEALRLIWDHAPRWALAQLQEGGAASTLTGMVMMAGYRGFFVLGGLVLGTAGIVLWRYAYPEKPPKPAPETRYILKLSSDSIYVTVPALGTETATNVAEQFLRLDRQPVKLSRPPKSAVERLERAVIEILAAHRAHPTDPAGHHAAVPLYEHSLDVARKLVERSQDPLARVAGFAHDLGKLIAYRRDPKVPNGWKVEIAAHDQMSANLVRLLPEYAALPEEEQLVLRYVLKYYHAPLHVPAHAPNRVRVLIQKLRLADSLVTNENQQRPAELVGDDKVVQTVADTLIELIPNLNINQYRPAEHPEGFTGEAFDYCAVLEYPLRLGLSAHMRDEKTVQRLALRTEKKKGQDHPAAPVIHKALRQTGLLIETYEGVTPANGRFAVRSGKSLFRDCFLLDRTKIEKMYPEAITVWGKIPPYKLNVDLAATTRDEAKTPGPAQAPE